MTSGEDGMEKVSDSATTSTTTTTTAANSSSPTIRTSATTPMLSTTSITTPHSTATTQLPENTTRFAPEDGVLIKPAPQHVESGYSSMANSQAVPQPQSPQDAAQSRLQLQCLAQASEARSVRTSLTLSEITNSPSTTGTGGRDLAVGVGSGWGGEARPKPPVSQFAQQQSSPSSPPPKLISAHTPITSGPQEYCASAAATTAAIRAPAISPKSNAAEDAPTTPTLSQATGGALAAPGSGGAGGTTLMTAPPSISPPKSTLAGAKRTSSGAIKTAALSVPNSPLEMLSPSQLGGVPASPRVDPSRIQELSAQLRTRLKYARIKVDNNWTTKSLDQVESIYHSNHNSPARGATTNTNAATAMVGRDHADERDDGLSAFGPPLHHARRHGHSRTASEPMNHFHHLGNDGAKTYENFWKERAPFTKMLEKLTSTGQPIGPGNGNGAGAGGYYQPNPYQHQYHHHHQQYGGPPPPGAGNHQYSQPPPRSPAHDGRHYEQQHQHHYHQQQPPSPAQRTIRPPPPLTPSHSNLSNYSAGYKDSPQPPSTPRQQSHHQQHSQQHQQAFQHHNPHPSLTRGISNKSAEEEAVESLMFLMSSPGTTATPRREPRAFQGYQVNVGSRRGSILRENSDGWTGSNGGAGGGVGSGAGVSSVNGTEVDLDVTDAEELVGGDGDEDEDDDLPPMVGRGIGGHGIGLGVGVGVGVGVGGVGVGVGRDVVEFRRRSDGAIRYTPATGVSGSAEKVGRARGRTIGQAGATRPVIKGKNVAAGAGIPSGGAGTKRKLGVAVGVGGGAAAGGGNGSGRRLAPAFNPT